MQLNPRYGADPIITLDGSPADIVEPTIRQRHRLAAALASFDDEQWAHQSRCDRWSTRDVIVHLDSTNFFWTQSIVAGRRGEPTRFLATFDPVATPAELVAGSRTVTTREVLERFVASTETLTGLLAQLGDDDWSTVAEAPPGHLALSVVIHHALWDAWVHERDIMLPLGITPVEEADEIAACLRYAAALSPALAVDNGTIRSGSITLAATDPELSMVVDIGDTIAVRSGTGADPALRGDAVALVEALSLRVPLDQQRAPQWALMLRGLSDVFEIDES